MGPFYKVERLEIEHFKNLIKIVSSYFKCTTKQHFSLHQ